MNVHKLFMDMHEEWVQDNEFVTNQSEYLYKSYVNQYIKPFCKDITEQDKISEELLGIISYERENAFKVGYKTALSLILSGLIK